MRKITIVLAVIIVVILAGVGVYRFVRLQPESAPLLTETYPVIPPWQLRLDGIDYQNEFWMPESNVMGKGCPKQTTSPNVVYGVDGQYTGVAFYMQDIIQPEGEIKYRLFCRMQTNPNISQGEAFQGALTLWTSIAYQNVDAPYGGQPITSRIEIENGVGKVTKLTTSISMPPYRVQENVRAVIVEGINSPGIVVYNIPVWQTKVVLLANGELALMADKAEADKLIASLVTVSQRYTMMPGGWIRETEFRPRQVRKDFYFLQTQETVSDVFKTTAVSIRAVYCNHACHDYEVAATGATTSDVQAAQDKALKEMEFLVEFKDGSYAFFHR